MKRTIWLDMDGTIANLYAVDGWLPMLRAYDPTPYANAEPLVNMSLLARYLNKAQRNGYNIAIVTALSKTSTPEYDKKVIKAKAKWLRKHLKSVKFDEVRYVPYTFVKNDVNAGDDILFDDEDRHLTAWTGTAVNAVDLLKTLRTI